MQCFLWQNIFDASRFLACIMFLIGFGGCTFDKFVCVRNEKQCCFVAIVSVAIGNIYRGDFFFCKKTIACRDGVEGSSETR